MANTTHFNGKVIDSITEPPLLQANCTPSAGFGSTATAIPTARSTDLAGRIDVLSQGTGQAANPTVAVVFTEALAAVPRGITVTRDDIVAPAGGYWAVTTKAATGFTMTFVGTPVAGSTYSADYDVRA
jgi:hypothetical protein